MDDASNRPVKPKPLRPKRPHCWKLPHLVVDAKRLGHILSDAGIRTIRTWDAAGKLPKPIKLGGRTLWYLPEIRDWLRAGAPDRETWEAMKAAVKK